MSCASDLPSDGRGAQARSLPDEKINEAKRVLAYTLTAQVHGEEEAKAAGQARRRHSLPAARI
jgi:tyrosyl-tRNA synthetase